MWRKQVKRAKKRVRQLTRPVSKKNGANDRARTDDLLITNELLYQLSYIGTVFIIYSSSGEKQAGEIFF